jgi:long-chain fatty acid transport protein
MRKSTTLVVGAVTLVLGTVSAEAQLASGRRQIGQAPVQFNLAPPGARSLGMGASFIGLADDATASESNPAGLTILTRPEISGHLRLSSFRNEFPDTVSGRGFQTFDNSVTSPAFFSLVYPYRRAAISFYVQRAADFKSSSVFEGRFTDRLANGAPLVVNDVDTTRTNFQVTHLGLSLAFKVGPKLSVGGSVRQTQLKLDSLTNVTFTYPNFAGFSDTLELTSNNKDNSVTFNAGILANPSSKLSIGAVVKKGASLELPAQVTSRSIFPGGNNNNNVSGNTFVAVPTSFGGGLAYRPTDRLTVLADVVHILYSDLDPGDSVGSIFVQYGEGGGEEIKDATELHLGTEYAWSAGKNMLLALRAGVYTDPDHDGLGGVDSSQVHATFGGGVVLNNKVQIDAAANIGKRVREGLLSFVARF